MNKDIVIRLVDRSRSGQEAKRKTKGPSRNAGGQRSGECAEPGCTEAPRENKPYCGRHIDKMPYVARLMEEFASLEAEKAAAKPPKRLLREAVLALAGFGQPRISTEKLGVLINCPPLVAERVAEALKLKREKTKRGRAAWRIRAAS